MPMYEFRCEKCGYLIEKLISYVDSKELRLCKRMDDYKALGLNAICNGKMIKQISKGSFSLNGGCWERDGYSTKQIKREK